MLQVNVWTRDTRFLSNDMNTQELDHQVDILHCSYQKGCNVEENTRGRFGKRASS
jgi:hypothetical protein